MIGNDIVDLQAAATQSNWRRPGYLQKVFTGDEKKQILAAKDPDLLVWIFWSMKEASYKAHQRKLSLKRSFTPSQISCKLSRREKFSASGKVNIEQEVYNTETLVKGSYIHTTATTSAAIKTFSRIYPFSADLKNKILEEISVETGLPQSSFSFKKDNNRVPFIGVEGQNHDYPVSLSHHGQYSAICLPLMKD